MTEFGTAGAARLVRSNATRAVNGLRYALGHDFAVPQPTPRDRVWRQDKVQLWRYRSDRVIHGPPVLLVFGLVSRSSLFDLYERVSLARTLRDAGFDVFLVDWGTADAGDADNTLETYVGRLLPRAIRAVLRCAGAEACTLVGYCMGGNLVLLTAAGQPQLPIANVVTMATAIDWDHMPGQVDPLRDPDVVPEWFTDGSGCVPGAVIARFFRIRRPTSDLVQTLNLWENLGSDAYVAGHQAIARWTGDHVPMPRGVARQVLEQWLRDNAFRTNRLRLGGRPVDLGSISVPVLAVLTLRDEVVPPAVARPVLDVIGSRDAELVELDAGHLGLVVGRSAHAVLHPRLIDWLIAHGEPSEPVGEPR